MRIRRTLWSWLLGLTLTCAVLLAVANTWVHGQYPYGSEATAALASDTAVTVMRTDDAITFIPAQAKAGFVFYPGGLVPTEAYAPLLRSLAEEGILCVALDMPLRLAVLDMYAADGIPAKYPGITRWAIGGHSLGGAMAASYAAKHADEYAALVLLAAYSTAALPEDIAVISIYGDADGVMDREKYAQYRPNLPGNTLEVILAGGNHAQFGDYGHQKGDGRATISPEEQLVQTLQALLPVLLGQE